ncbi:MAG: hypothetical protein KGL39_46405 [Patescibacteria group bacterium]|nr:hypothetical protein [Patescibacteria group bacterium]
MIDLIKDNWPVITVAAAWLARERLNIVALGSWVADNGGIVGITKKLFVGLPQKGAEDTKGKTT